MYSWIEGATRKTAKRPFATRAKKREIHLKKFQVWNLIDNPMSLQYFISKNLLERKRNHLIAFQICILRKLDRALST